MPHPLLTSLLLGLGLTAGLPAAVEKTELFTAGAGGYALYRIPALVVTPQQTVLAACEARQSGRGDWDHVDLFMRRSTDGGRTWEPARRLIGQGDAPAGLQRNPAAVAAGLGRDGVFTFNNPTWIADSATGETHLLYCIEYARAFIITTRDGGATFTRPREITGAFESFRTRDNYAWRVLAIGPGHGTRLASGRLVAAVWLSTGEGGHAHRPSVVATIHSDDHGVTWQAGGIAAGRGDNLINPSETIVIESEPGKVMLNIRNESPGNRRAVAWSASGNSGWSRPAFVESLWEPVCMAAMVRAPDGTLVFSNPATLEPNPARPDAISRQRKNLGLRTSRDAGKTWSEPFGLESGPSAYSDLAVAPDGTLLCFYEHGGANPYERMSVARVALPLPPRSRP
jgi:sialidase-1